LKPATTVPPPNLQQIWYGYTSTCSAEPFRRNRWTRESLQTSLWQPLVPTLRFKPRCAGDRSRGKSPTSTPSRLTSGCLSPRPNSICPPAPPQHPGQSPGLPGASRSMAHCQSTLKARRATPLPAYTWNASSGLSRVLGLRAARPQTACACLPRHHTLRTGTGLALNSQLHYKLIQQGTPRSGIS
jgi:hypothetical protein